MQHTCVLFLTAIKYMRHICMFPKDWYINIVYINTKVNVMNKYLHTNALSIATTM